MKNKLKILFVIILYSFTMSDFVLANTVGIEELIEMDDNNSKYILNKYLDESCIYKTKNHHTAYIAEEDSLVISGIYRKNLSGHLIINNLSNNEVVQFRQLLEKFNKWYKINQSANEDLDRRPIGKSSNLYFYYSSGIRNGNPSSYNDSLIITNRQITTQRSEGYYNNLTRSSPSSAILFFNKSDVSKLLKFLTVQKIDKIRKEKLDIYIQEQHDKKILQEQGVLEQEKKSQRLDKLFN